jgi:hypothetical protein
MKIYPFLLLGFCCLLAVFSCDSEPDNFSIEQGTEYYPLAVGKYWIYKVDSTIFDPNGDSTVSFSTTFVKEEITDTLLDNEGNVAFRYERYERSADTLPWQVKKVFTATLDGKQAIRTEDNLRFIKMTFPLRENNRWNGNAYFDPSLIVTVAGESLEMFKSWEYKIEAVGKADTVGTFAFEAVTVVEEAASENLIELRSSLAKYAKGIGLVYRELWILDTQCIEACDGQSWEEKAEKGFILKQYILEHN